LIESFAIDIGHGTPLATGDADEQCGVAGSFLLDVGISSSYHIAKFFRLTEERVSLAKATTEATAASERRPPLSEKAFSQPHIALRDVPQGEALRDVVLEGEILDKETEMRPEFSRSPRMPIDINAVITRALTAAGLMKP